MHTDDSEPDAWWRVDLGTEHVITRVMVTSRGEAAPQSHAPAIRTETSGLLGKQGGFSRSEKVTSPVNLGQAEPDQTIGLTIQY